MSKAYKGSATFVTLAEAASYLGVSKATLRNWDRDDKLKAMRHPINKYRVYELESLRRLKKQESLLDEEELLTPVPTTVASDSRTVKRVISRLHGILRDTDGNSSIIQRFDDLTKMLFLKLVTERDGSSESIFERQEGESDLSYAKRLRRGYAERAAKYPEIIPRRFATLECSDQAIVQSGECLAVVSFSEAAFDVKGVAYEEVIRGTFDKGDHQQFFTPHQVVSFMVALQRPFLSGVVADPASGTAGFMAEVVRAGAPYKRLLALEIDERLAWVSGINLLLHGAKSFHTTCLTSGGTLGPNAATYFGTVDAIITNPPFGSDFSDQPALESFELGKGRGSRRRGILFIERCYDLLKPGGTVAIIIDEGVLNLPSAQDVRQFILDRFDILAIVSLPESAFMPYANVIASILLLRRSTGRNRSHRVFFGKAENIGRRANGDDDTIYETDGTSRPNSDLPAILDLWRDALDGHKIPPSELAYVANVSENLKDDESLRLDFRYHHPSRDLSRALLERATNPIFAIADLCEERNETVIPATEMADQLILYTGLANIESRTGVAQQSPTPAGSLKSAVKRYEPNDIVFARMRPALRKVALMSFKEGGYVSPECSVLTVRRDDSGSPLIDPHILAAILRSDFVFGQILHLIVGIGRPRLNSSDLRRVRIPVPPTSLQDAGRQRLQAGLTAARQLRQKAQSFQEEATNLEGKAVEEVAEFLLNGKAQ